MDVENKWHRRFLAMAKMVASWSKDPSTQCGAVIVRPDKSIASVGFNGFPRGCNDTPDLYADRPKKYSRVVHAEVNAVLACAQRPVGFTLYTWPPGHGPTCDRCAGVVIQSGITTVVYQLSDVPFAGGRWNEAIDSGLQMYSEAGLTLIGLHP